jgi:hypothetical protein
MEKECSPTPISPRGSRLSLDSTSQKVQGNLSPVRVSSPRTSKKGDRLHSTTIDTITALSFTVLSTHILLDKNNNPFIVCIIVIIVIQFFLILFNI